MSRDQRVEEANFQIKFRSESFTSENVSTKTITICQKLCRIEVAAFVTTLAFGLHSVISTNLLMEKICKIDMNLSLHVCQNLDKYKDFSNLVEEKVTTINLISTFLSSISR